jgi:hypothetical protein
MEAVLDSLEDQTYIVQQQVESQVAIQELFINQAATSQEVHSNQA